MALNIKNDETQRLSRELAELTGESITTAVTVAVRERLERMRAGREDAEQQVARVVAIGRQIAAAVSASDLGIDDLYDERGLPA
ncbi:type II toxin-antitoxin system VapB family antitoxin [Frankia sp. Cppng1_Ct_nod]|uniref:type II toxin-antitoxin system VapB family antitoxin n=1 Tax=Frankia sp. Cppng1_Ct_nod TaxID=2897162 RepID=UPI00104191CC|nr:type II toxin-antitoxin system VapB family antitoxin [Frankia sp. Cppng1_Ct_nod]